MWPNNNNNKCNKVIWLKAASPTWICPILNAIIVPWTHISQPLPRTVHPFFHSSPVRPTHTHAYHATCDIFSNTNRIYALRQMRTKKRIFSFVARARKKTHTERASSYNKMTGFTWSSPIHTKPERTSSQIILTKGRIACPTVIEHWMIPFAAYTAAETPNAFHWARNPKMLTTWFLGRLGERETAPKPHLDRFSQFLHDSPW